MGVMLIDLSQIALATVMHTYQEGDKLDTRLVRHLILTTLKHNALKFKNDYSKVIICVDNAKHGYWRRDIAPYYKKNRAKNREQSNWDWDGYFEGLHTVVQELKDHMPYYVIDADKCEADDSIAVLTQYFSVRNEQVLIVSSDGDFTQLHKFKNVKQWSPMQKKWVKPKVSPSIDLVTKLLKGDKKDNVASVNVRSDFLSTKVDGERQPPIKSSLIESVADCLSDEQIKAQLSESQFARYLENRVLIDFDYIRDDVKISIINMYESYKLNPRNKIYPYFVKSGLSKLLSQIGEF